MRILGIEAHYPKPHLSRPAPGHQIYPYLLRGVPIERPNHVWSTDITYIPMRGGFLYLVAVMDWFSRFVLSWELSNRDGDQLLPGRTRRGLPLRPARNLELRPGLTSSPRPSSWLHSKRRGILIQYGWSRPCARQRFHRTAVALAQVRADLSRRLRQPASICSRHGEITFTSTTTSGRTRRSVIGRRQIVFSRTNSEGTDRPLDGGLCPPNPPGSLALLYSRMDAFRFTPNRRLHVQSICLLGG